jgi:hypothetical protein
MSSIATLAMRVLKHSVTAKSDCVFLLSSFASIALASLLRCGSPGLSYKVNIRSLAIYSALSSIWAAVRPAMHVTPNFQPRPAEWPRAP